MVLELIFILSDNGRMCRKMRRQYYYEIPLQEVKIVEN